MRTVDGGGTRRGVPASGLAALVAVIGLVTATTAAVLLAAGQRDATRQQLERRTALVAEAVANEAARYVDTLRTVAAAMGAFDRLTAGKFMDVTAPLAEMRLAGAASIAFLIPAGDDDLAATQALWRSREAPGLVLRPRGSGREHIFSIFSRPLDRATVSRVGVDATAVTAPARALLESRRSGEVTVSDTYQLIIDRHLPAAQRQLSFVLSAPVYRPGPDGRRSFLGWVLMGLRGQSFIGATLARVSQDLLDITLHASNANGTSVAVAVLRASSSGDPDLTRTVDVGVADRRWRLRVEAERGRLPGGATALPGVVGVAGVLLTVLLTGLVYTLATGRARARALVRSATADLAAAEAAAREQADLFSAILDGVSDGVGVVDEEGAFIMHNPAAKAILGATADVDGPDNWQEHYGIYAPDGITPYPTDRLPLVRALAGESSEQVEMVIRNASHPDGIAITVSGRPLNAPHGVRGAVAVFHDITERKTAEVELAATVAALREREADLQAFAAVTAHDLKTPLASVAGYADLLAEDLENGGDLAELRATATRILTGVRRMRQLIDDMLTYATARDRQLNLDTIDLRVLVAEVVAERTAHRRVQAKTDEPLPDVYVGPLPTVCGDPVMIRQLLDNIIGNSLKYTVPGRPARIDIAAQPVDAPGWTRVEIADRGIGIPAADKVEVFSPFRRSASHAAYSGTGLGLAICKRIVDRHGGTIGMTENPGGGTRVFFTLPSHPTPSLDHDDRGLVGRQ